MNKLIPKGQEGWLSSVDNFVDKAEPWANGIGLAGAGIGIGTAATGVGIPVGALIYEYSQVPSIFVDGYLTIRSATKGDWGGVAWNGTELGLDFLGAKAARGLSKTIATPVEKKVVGTTIKSGTHPPRGPRLRKHYAAADKAAYQKEAKQAASYLAKRGVRPAQGNYYKKKLNELITKQLTIQNDAIKSGTQLFLLDANKYITPAGSLLIQLPFTIKDIEDKNKKK